MTLSLQLRTAVKGDIVYVYPKNDIRNGFLVSVTDVFEGSEDIGYHGSPHYERFIRGNLINDGVTREFGSTEYTWQVAEDLIHFYIGQFLIFRRHMLVALDGQPD